MGINLSVFKKKRNGGSGKNNMLSLVDGDNYLRFVPRSTAYFRDDDPDIAYTYKAHFRIHPEHKFLMCPKSAHINKSCPICSAASVLYESKNEADLEIARKIKPVKRAVFNVVALPSVDPNDIPPSGLKIIPYECGFTIYKTLVDLFLEDPENDFLRIKEGHIIRIKKEIVGEWPKYTVSRHAKTFDLTPFLPDDYMDTIDELANFLEPEKDYETLESILESGLSLGKKPSSPYTLSKKVAEHKEEPKPVEEVEVEAEAEAEVEVKPALKKEVKKVKKTSTKKGDKPKCFAEKFDGSKDECQECGYKKECRDAWLSSLDEDF